MRRFSDKRNILARRQAFYGQNGFVFLWRAAFDLKGEPIQGAINHNRLSAGKAVPIQSQMQTPRA